MKKCRNCEKTWSVIKEHPRKKDCSSECRYRAKYGREPQPHTHILPGLNRHQLRAIVFDHYGRKCVFCKRSMKKMCIDHIFEDGPNERQKWSEVRSLREIIRRGFPPNYQILCTRCNILKSWANTPGLQQDRAKELISISVPRLFEQKIPRNYRHRL